MFPIMEFKKRFREILEAMDDILDTCDDMPEAAYEDFEELNAEMEDALMLFDILDPEGADWEEDVIGALDAIADLCNGYQALALRIPEITAEAERLNMAINMAKGNFRPNEVLS